MSTCTPTEKRRASVFLEKEVVRVKKELFYSNPNSQLNGTIDERFSGVLEKGSPTRVGNQTKSKQTKNSALGAAAANMRRNQTQQSKKEGNLRERKPIPKAGSRGHLEEIKTI